MTRSSDHPPHVGIFDSGVGGLSVLRSLRHALPGCRLTYLADNRNLPYGDKSATWLNARCIELTAHLLERGATLILVACNTATTHTIASLRARWPDVPFVGVEPGVKPAALSSARRRIAVMATPATAASKRLRELVDSHAADAQVRLLPCPGLAQAIEDADETSLARLIDETCAAVRAADVDTVVLGCTHYPLVADRLSEQLGAEVHLVDTAEAIARRVHSLLSTQLGAGPASVHVVATGATTAVASAMQRWLGEMVAVEPWAG